MIFVFTFINNYMTKMGWLRTRNITIKDEPRNILINEEGGDWRMQIADQQIG
jgi:hypothetical protein